MGQVNVLIGGRSYPLACRDGEEAHLIELAHMIESKTGGLTAALGAMSEPRLLLMAGIQVADELFAARRHSETRQQGIAAAPADDSRIAALAVRLTILADNLERDCSEAIDVAGRGVERDGLDAA